MACRLAAEGKHILTLTVRKKKPATKTYLDFNTYTVKDGDILHTPVRGVSTGMARSVLPHSAALELGDHPLAGEHRRPGPLEQGHGLPVHPRPADHPARGRAVLPAVTVRTDVEEGLRRAPLFT